MKKRLISLVLAILAGFTITAGIEGTAQAAASQIVIYNSKYSCSTITAHNWTRGEHYDIAPGRYHAITDYGSAVVDVDKGASGCDVDSWYKWDEPLSDLGYEAPRSAGVCYNNEDESSNPYSAYYNEVTGYHNYAKRDCVT